MENVRDNMICAITADILDNKIKTFIELINFVREKYGEDGVITVSIKTSFFKELVDTNYSILKGDNV